MKGGQKEAITELMQESAQNYLRKVSLQICMGGKPYMQGKNLIRRKLKGSGTRPEKSKSLRKRG